jgi:hypothetical protein
MLQIAKHVLIHFVTSFNLDVWVKSNTHYFYWVQTFAISERSTRRISMIFSGVFYDMIRIWKKLFKKISLSWAWTRNFQYFSNSPYYKIIIFFYHTIIEYIFWITKKLSNCNKIYKIVIKFYQSVIKIIKL